LGDSSPKQSRVQRLDVEMARSPAFDGDKSPAQSADKSAHSKACGVGFWQDFLRDKTEQS